MTKKFRLQPHEAGYLRLLTSTFAGLDYATANATVAAKSRQAQKMFKVIREVQIKALDGLVSEYVRAALVNKHVIKPDERLHFLFDPTDSNTKDEVIAIPQEEYEKNQKSPQ